MNSLLHFCSFIQFSQLASNLTYFYPSLHFLFALTFNQSCCNFLSMFVSRSEPRSLKYNLNIVILGLGSLYKSGLRSPPKTIGQISFPSSRHSQKLPTTCWELFRSTGTSNSSQSFWPRRWAQRFGCDSLLANEVNRKWNS